MKRFDIRTGLLLLAALMAGGYFAYPRFVTNSTYAQEQQASGIAYEQLKTANNLSDAFKHVAKALRPSVVSISTESKPLNVAIQQFRSPLMPFGLSPFFEDKNLQSFQSFKVPEQLPGKQGLGSGMIVRSDGHILTNHHVIKGAAKINVTLSDDRTYSAKVVGSDPETDLAVLKIDASGLQPVEWADSESAEVGEWVVAIGSPFGLNQTVTSGIISAMGRDDMGIASYENFIQTDAAINPGNSGGPLVNLKGELLGINTAIASRSGAYNGIGFAIPSSMANRVMNSIVDHGKVARGYLGVMIQNLEEGLASSFSFDGEGVLIGDVVPGGPGEQGGLQPGDIVTQLNDKPISSSSELRNRVADLAPGSTVKMEVVRNGSVMSFSINLGLRDQAKLASYRSGSGDSSDSASKIELGLSVQSLTGDVKLKLNSEFDRGVVITDADSSGLAWQAGIREGDIIVSINNQAIDSISDFEQAMDSVDVSKGVRLRVHRDGVTRFVFLKSMR
ncbi:MAG: DegQ family serine endoprotease [Mariniblastus sp.]